MWNSGTVLQTVSVRIIVRLSLSFYKPSTTRSHEAACIPINYCYGHKWNHANNLYNSILQILIPNSSYNYHLIIYELLTHMIETQVPYPLQNICKALRESPLHENVVFSVCARMGSAAYILSVMWKSIDNISD